MALRRIAKLQCGGRDLNTGSCSSSCTNERNNNCNGFHANMEEKRSNVSLFDILTHCGNHDCIRYFCDICIH